MFLISVVVTTYNWPLALHLSLSALFAQDDPYFEIIVADDGSNPDNLARNQAICAQSPVPLHYVYHEDLGFRAAAIRNKAVLRGKGDYIIFLDGDCVVRPDFISSHRRLAEPGYFVPGNRVLLNKNYTDQVMVSAIPLHTQSFGYFLALRVQNKINRIVPLITLPLGDLRKLFPNKWQKAMTCNLGLWRHDFLNVNGLDELFEGWGFEDSDLVVRLIHHGIKRKEGRFAVPVLHLWHQQNNRAQHAQNYQRLLDRVRQPGFVRAVQGVSQYVTDVV